MINWFKRQGRAAPTAARAPDGTVIYAIGDIHGRLDLLRNLEGQIERHADQFDATRRLIVCLGDYVDRGPDSRGVIEHLLQGPPAGFERVCLIGNHESYMIRVLDGDDVLSAWLDNGGAETLTSYDIEPPPWFDLADRAPAVQAELRDNLPETHESFLRALAHSHREGGYFFAHAGVRPGVPLERQDREDLMWIRREFLNDESDFGAVVVHGHSISERPDDLPNRIGVDTGAYASGRLTCVALWQDQRQFLQT